MTMTTGIRHLLSVADLSPADIEALLRRAAELKDTPAPQVLAGRTVALVFEKPSLRTRVSFDVAIHQLGGHALYLGRDEVGMGVREPVSDTARILSRYVDAIVVRTFAQATLETLAQYSSVPVINALSDAEHPCQALADLLTIQEHKGRLAGNTVSYIGDGNNVARSLCLAVASASVGASFTIASPLPATGWTRETLEETRKPAQPRREGARSASVSDSPVEARGRRRRGVHRRVDQHGPGGRIRDSPSGIPRLPRRFRPDGVGWGRSAVHAPAARAPGEEIAEGMLEHPQSVVFDQAENRLHVQRAILAELFSTEG